MEQNVISKFNLHRFVTVFLVFGLGSQVQLAQAQPNPTTLQCGPNYFTWTETPATTNVLELDTTHTTMITHKYIALAAVNDDMQLAGSCPTECPMKSTPEYTENYTNISWNSYTQKYERSVIVDALVFCDPEEPGCMDTSANNYDPDANVDDNSCTYDVWGCMDSSATNYNYLATMSDGSCTYDVYGCTDPSATNYNSSATINDSSCTYPPPEVWGCTDPLATNYNSSATHDDGSCTY